MRITLLVPLILPIGVLLLTKGMYVEWGEMLIVVLASCALPLLIGQRCKQPEVPHFFTAGTAFVFYWGFSLFDLIADHFLYYLPEEGDYVDGRPLTLGEKIHEFHDDLWAVSWVPPFISLIWSFGWSQRFNMTDMKNR